jgi:signal transduction histidine kinase
VDLDHVDGYTVLTVSDDGKGFHPELLGKNGAEVGMGILNMREISEFIGGRLHIETSPGQGTTIRVELARSNIAMDQGELA